MQKEANMQEEKGVQKKPTNPLHGMTLEKILIILVDHYGWEELGERINIRCFKMDSSIGSSLKFLRKTDWARAKVEKLYIDSIKKFK
ncbi:VF530 family protein [Sulfurimonas sp.]|uniref:VF530 family protein n=1 Tax=Sulfurimonas sp. TaxID=2022749 RepID=UPI0025F295E8|nr:VF530 family protein [Sulfurimonas sp.]